MTPEEFSRRVDALCHTPNYQISFAEFARHVLAARDVHTLQAWRKGRHAIPQRVIDYVSSIISIEVEPDLYDAALDTFTIRVARVPRRPMHGA